MSPQPREWFADVQDESILRLLDPLDEGKPDLAPATIWRDYIRTVGRTPNGIWGGKLMWNQTPLLLNRAQGLPDRSGEACSPRYATSSAATRSWCTYTDRTLCLKLSRFGARSDPSLARPSRPGA